VVSDRRFGTIYRSHLQRSSCRRTFSPWPLKTEPLSSPETSVLNHLMPRNNPEDGKIQANGWSAPPCIFMEPEGSLTYSQLPTICLYPAHTLLSHQVSHRRYFSGNTIAHNLPKALITAAETCAAYTTLVSGLQDRQEQSFETPEGMHHATTGTHFRSSATPRLT
jgi:hypothetical protein